MHDCQKCQTPLHGHESFCPICGLKQTVRPEYQGANDLKQYMRANNPWLLIVLTLAGGVAIFFAVQNSWIGILLKRGALPEEQTMTQGTARQKIESTIMQNLAQQSTSGKFTYTCNDSPTDINCPQPVNLSIETALKHPEQRKEIIEPVKGLMDAAKINTITLNDSKSHAVVTLTLPPDKDAAPIGDATNPDGSANSDQ